MTRVLRVDSLAPSREALEQGAAIVRRGGLVAFPTESFYGLGASALDPEALARVFAVKGRSESRPLLVLVDSVAMAETLVVDVPAGARELMARHWPGPLTIVLKAAPGVPEKLTAGTGTLGMRVPGHPVARGLVRTAGIPVTAPSANPSGSDPPTTAEEVRRYFERDLDLILDGGSTAGGTGSTVADCTTWPPRVLRAGPVIV